MTEHARALMIAKLQVILHWSLVEVRNLARSEGHQQIYDLADAVEFFPSLVLRWDDEQANLVLPALRQYEAKYPGSSGRYTSILELDEQQFNHIYRPNQFCWDAEADPDFVSAEKVNP